MFRYGKRSEYDIPAEANTKQYQRAFLAEHLPRHAGPAARVLELGANTAFETLLALDAAERWVADPYDGLAGGGMDRIPPHPPQLTIRRCAIGEDSEALPSGHFDLVFSSSVLEHVGQNDTACDVFPARRPPAAQELPRRRLAAELFRITAPSGVHLHTVDHAPRNLTLVRNFLEAGFAPLVDEPLPRLDDLLHDPEAVRQLRSWTDPRQPIDFPELHSVLIVGLRKPAGPWQARVLPRRPGAFTRFRGRAGGMLHLLLRSWLARRFGI